MRSRGVHSGTAEESESDISTVKIAWIEKQGQTRPEAELLIEYLRRVGFVVDLVTMEDLSTVGPRDYPLVIVEAGDQLDAEVLDIVVELRVSTLSMLVVLLNQATSKQIVHALKTGADAVWSYAEPEPVLYARAKALLRRWWNSGDF